MCKTFIRVTDEGQGKFGKLPVASLSSRVGVDLGSTLSPYPFVTLMNDFRQRDGTGP